MTIRVKANHIHWIAGFIEGEGSFTWCGSTICVSATQVDREPIDKLFKLLGGGTNVFSRKEIKSNGGIYNRWNAYGPRAAGIMMTLYPLMTKRRQLKIKELLDRWMSGGRSETHRKSFFACGHKKNSEYTFINSHGYLACRLCDRANKNKSQRKIRALRKVHFYSGPTGFNLI